MVSKYFKIQELVPKELFDLVHNDVLWGVFDDKLILSIDELKKTFNSGTMYINNWFWGLGRSQSGLRTKGSTHYSPTSQHSIGKAIDCVFSDYDREDIRTFIKNNPDKFPYIRRLEGGVSWLHVDVKETGRDTIVEFYS